MSPSTICQNTRPNRKSEIGH